MLLRLRVLSPLLGLVLVSGLGLVAISPPAAATSTILCRGYDGCNQLGMSAAGYRMASGTMWWRMYPGHNCTNYAAYRMVKSGMPNERPWSGDGNASNWGKANASVTDSVPAVGAVAWWAANVRPAGSSGHLAYVERVVSAEEIIVSQDSWGGDFSWARITRAGGSWPSGFVHFNDVPLKSTVAPTVSGTPRVASILSASGGSWSESGVSLSYQWRANGRAIENATSPTFKVRLAQVGQRISVRVTATKLGYPTTSATSLQTAAVQPGQLTNTVRPTITGVAQVDSLVRVVAGTWTPSPSSLAYQWRSGGVPIPGATGTEFRPRAAQVGKSLTVRVTATKEGYPAVFATSGATKRVAPGTFDVTRLPAVTGTPRLGDSLRLDRGEITSSGVDTSVQWLRAGVPIEGARRTTFAPTVADLGSRISASVRFTKPGYTTVVATSELTRRVKSRSALAVAATPGTERVGLAIGVTAEGVDPVPGRVRVEWRETSLKELTLRGGAVTTVVGGLPSGRRTLKIRYLGTDTVTVETVRRTVQIG